MLSGLFFLIINSGYYWLQVSVPIILYRFLVEIVGSPGQRLRQMKRIAVIVSSGVFAVVLSLPRLCAIYEFQLSRFPRLGSGFVNDIQIISETIPLLKMLLRSFFDASLLDSKGAGNPSMGFIIDYSNFIGIAAIIPLIIGFLSVKKHLKNKSLWALLLAGLGHLAVIRFKLVADAVRFFLPILNSITWHWRGGCILILLPFHILLVLDEQSPSYNVSRNNEEIDS